MATDQPWEWRRRTMESFRTLILNFQDRMINTDQFEWGTISYIQSLLERLEANWRGYGEQNQALRDHFDPLEGDTLLLDDALGEEVDRVARAYDMAKHRLETKIRDLSRVGTVQRYTPKPTEITLPTFGGHYHQYTAFRSAVIARVLEADYPPHSKIDLIMKALADDAKAHIGEVRGQDQEELDRIWEALESTYNNSYLLMRSHVGMIMDIPVIEKSSTPAYRLLIGVVTQNLHALGQLDIPTGQLDPVILEILLRKLDPEGITAWETTRPQEGLPTLQHLIKFLEARIVILSNTALQVARTKYKDDGQNHRNGGRERDDHGRRHQKRDHPSTSNGPPAKSSRNFAGPSASGAVSSKPSPPSNCPMDCEYKRPHFLWMCRAFRALDFQKRVDFIKEKKLCRRCITNRHPMEDCRGQKCADCHDDIHNQMLCPKYMVMAKAHLTRPSSTKRRRAIKGQANQSE